MKQAINETPKDELARFNLGNGEINLKGGI